MKHNLGAGLAVLALSAALAACGGSTGTAPATTAPAATSGSPAAPATASTAVDLKTASSTAGAIVVDAKGMSVYFFTKDVKDSGTSACTDACLAAWPPVTTTAERPSADGVTGTLGTIATPDGKKQVTLEGLPLYYYAKDTKPGDILGQGVNNVWYLAAPSGAMVKAGGTAAY
ncbi:hypothetical protein [Pseudarthrobacter sp. L1SW]|jgi:predicted lipoprotein with Yx(FWY)xxD motif|uniref:COG4315 family predicted lipoprotein n=1 Tax=Pseudarthrobacter sp. L1SW TaxID=2851598 RepID=UPI001E31D126|nr:hypothetical protein [Pseudarthrobacter sp. L1SW]UEL28276.1 hypothetical protein KTR40_17200 [Pseudarthrobacter sp. L1SW]